MARELGILLDDILTAIDRIGQETRAMTLESFAADWRSQYIVERAL